MGGTLQISRYESVHQLRRNVMWERLLRIVGIPDRVGRAARNPSEPLLGIHRFQPRVWPPRIGRHTLIGSRLRFADAIFPTGERHPALFSLSTFNFSADGTR
jgi:hypothetical protein